MFGVVLAAIAQTTALSGILHGNPQRPPFNVATYQGTFSDGATYLIQIPQFWNKTLVLYSHGYVFPGSSNPAYDVGDSTTGNYLLALGYALAGSSYATTGWAIQQALPDQIATLDTFAGLAGTPQRTIAWGHSMGGIITAGLIQQYPSRFDGALPMCGVLAGGVGFWNAYLDSAFAFNHLVAHDSLQLVDISNPLTNYDNAESDIDTAQNNAQGQARIALAAALSDTPGWFTTGYPEPPARDYTDREIFQFDWLQQSQFVFDYYLRAELEGRAGGNPSWNAGVDYKAQLAQSADRAEVKALYARAGLNLDQDLAQLTAAAQIQADAGALDYLSQNIIFDGQIGVPVLGLQTEGDGIVTNQNESAYASIVDKAGNASLLRQIYVDRAGHCAFTPGETIAAFRTLVARLNNGQWGNLGAKALNASAQGLGSGYNPYPPSYARFRPDPFLRPYTGTPRNAPRSRAALR